MTSAFPLRDETLRLAARHGLHLQEDLHFQEQGLDFRVAFGRDREGKEWALRIPRRPDVLPKVEREAKILRFVQTKLHVRVPDWQICTPELIAYPLITDSTALTFDAETYAVSWHIDQQSELYLSSLADTLRALHAADPSEAARAGIPVFEPSQVRQKFLDDLTRVKSELGLGAALEAQCRSWIANDALWPDFSVLVHGDLYAGHITTEKSGRVTGIIDWTEAEVSDPSIDFAGHLAVFGEESLAQLIDAYAALGGRTWPSIREHVKARHAASPIRYGLFALVSQSDVHVSAARVQLGVG